MSMAEQVKGESPTRLYVAAKKYVASFKSAIVMQKKFITLWNSLTLYPGGFTHSGYERFTQNTYERVYSYAIEDDLFVDTFFEAQK